MLPQFSLPKQMHTANGRARFAYVTLFTLNDSYLPAVLLSAFGLRQQKTKADLICLITPEITPSARKALNHLYDRVIEVDPIIIPHRLAGKRPYLPLVFTKCHALRLGSAGGLGTHYEKIALLDADLLPIKQYDHLFTLPTPAGSINEQKTNVMEWGQDGNFIIPDSVYKDGTWNWHQIYAACPHGRPIPKEITDRVNTDPTNMGVISSLLVLTPSQTEFEAILHELKKPDVRTRISEQYEWPEMQYLTGRWSGQWTNLDLRFHSLNGYPDLAALNGIHYTGFKPWQFRKEGSMARYGRRADFQYWHNTFRQMTKRHPELLQFKKLRRLQNQIDAFQNQANQPAQRDAHSSKKRHGRRPRKNK